jgi:hypothetical protein
MVLYLRVLTLKTKALWNFLEAFLWRHRRSQKFRWQSKDIIIKNY